MSSLRLHPDLRTRGLPMLPGPVFNFELVSTARRGRFYAIRAFYATVLLVILWAIHSAWSSAYDGIELPTKMVKWFALSALGGITVGQEILVLVLTPALVAGVIADEKKRKTLHYLMASQLTSSEIVLGKLFVRMLYVGVLLGVSVPVIEPPGHAGRDRSVAGRAGLRGDPEHGVVPGDALDLDLDDRASPARGLVHRLWPGRPLAGGTVCREPAASRSAADDR